MAKSDRKTIDKVFVLLGTAVIAVLLVIGGLAWHAYDFANSSVSTQLASQKIYFPVAGSPAITALPKANQIQMDKYAGEQLLNGAQAQVFANDFIAFHLSEVANGQTYAQVSAASLANPNDAQLKQETQTLFQGETLRGLLLGDGYAYWTFGQIAQYAAITAFAGAAVMLILVLLGLRDIARRR
ncbi:MAG TPA: hypothetical protein VMQ58_01940 [Candidatus Saccharimonadales bacterium]|jgi:hypothetical protein|nr:hypothetical protein [Candidatus Saccharimonadales bacterium]